MASAQHRRAVGIFPDRPTTASALQALQDSGFAMKRVSVIARDGDKQGAIAGVDVDNNVTNKSDQAGAIGAAAGGVLGGVTGLLVGLGAFTIPGIGPILLAGEATALISTLIGGAVGAAAGGLIGALIGLGIPEDRARRYSDRVAQGEYLVMLKGTDPEIARAEKSLRQQGIQDWGVYDVREEKHDGNGGVSSSSEDRSSGEDKLSAFSPPIVDANTTERSPTATHRYIDSTHLEATHVTTTDELPVARQQTNYVEDFDAFYGGSSSPAPADSTVDSTVDPARANAYNMVDYPTDQNLQRQTEESTYQTVRQDGGTQNPFSLNATDHVTDASAARVEGEKRAIALFSDRQALESALSSLKNAGFPMYKVSILMRDMDSSQAFSTGEARTPGNMSATSQSGASDHNPLGNTPNLLTNLNRVNVPGLGDILLVGAEAPALTQSLSSQVLGASGSSLESALTRFGIPAEKAQFYSSRIARGQSLMMVKGTANEALQAASVLDQHGIQDWGIYAIAPQNVYP